VCSINARVPLAGGGEKELAQTPPRVCFFRLWRGRRSLGLRLSLPILGKDDAAATAFGWNGPGQGNAALGAGGQIVHQDCDGLRFHWISKSTYH